MLSFSSLFLFHFEVLLLNPCYRYQATPEKIIITGSILVCSLFEKGFPDSPVGKESAYNAGDPGSIPSLGRSAGEGIGYSLQYSWASLVAQLIKNLPTMRETWV